MRLLSELFPDAQTRLDFAVEEPRPGWRIELEGCSRWAFVADQSCDLADIADQLNHGAWGLVGPESDVAEFGAMVMALKNGGTPYVAIGLVRQLAEHIGPPVEDRPSNGHEAPRRNPLTRREFEVLQALAAGLTDEAIAQRLSISVHTVRTHLQSLFEKLEVSGRLRVIVKARTLGLLDEPGARGTAARSRELATGARAS